jgi:hypothetical protein
LPGKNKYSIRSKHLLFIVLICISLNAYSQRDTLITGDKTILPTDITKIHSPHKATMYSALVPGLGQIYNKKYWKLPVIYGLAGIFIYTFDYNNNQYNKFTNGYLDLKSGKIDSFEGYSNVETINKIRDNFKRNRDLNVITLAAVYLLNVLDATVDAHLMDYDISDDLSLNLQPSLINSFDNQQAIGFTLSFSFNKN